MYDSTKVTKSTTNLVVIGNIAFDIVDFSKVDKQRKKLVNIGGACVYSTVSASLFYKTGMVGKIGNDFNITPFYRYNIDLLGVRKLEIPTTKFYSIWNSIDGQNRTVMGDVKPEMEVGYEDIPEKFLVAKHFHLTTATPEKQLELIEFIRKNTNATISVDTIENFADKPNCKKVFDSVDLAFIDKEFVNLLNCKAPKKVIKCGKSGCIFHSKEKNFMVKSKEIVKNVVDKTGAGDCLNGAFISLITNGIDEEKALKIAVNLASESVKYNGIMNLKSPIRMLEGEER